MKNITNIVERFRKPAHRATLTRCLTVVLLVFSLVLNTGLYVPTVDDNVTYDLGYEYGERRERGSDEDFVTMEVVLDRETDPDCETNPDCDLECEYECGCDENVYIAIEAVVEDDEILPALELYTETGAAENTINFVFPESPYIELDFEENEYGELVTNYNLLYGVSALYFTDGCETGQPVQVLLKDRDGFDPTAMPGVYFNVTYKAYIPGTNNYEETTRTVAPQQLGMIRTLSADVELFTLTFRIVGFIWQMYEHSNDLVFEGISQGTELRSIPELRGMIPRARNDYRNEGRWHLEGRQEIPDPFTVVDRDLTFIYKIPVTQFSFTVAEELNFGILQLDREILLNVGRGNRVSLNDNRLTGDVTYMGAAAVQFSGTAEDGSYVLVSTLPDEKGSPLHSMISIGNERIKDLSGNTPITWEYLDVAIVVPNDTRLGGTQQAHLLWTLVLDEPSD